MNPTVSQSVHVGTASVNNVCLCVRVRHTRTSCVPADIVKQVCATRVEVYVCSCVCVCVNVCWWVRAPGTSRVAGELGAAHSLTHIQHARLSSRMGMGDTLLVFKNSLIHAYIILLAPLLDRSSLIG